MMSADMPNSGEHPSDSLCGEALLYWNAALPEADHLPLTCLLKVPIPLSGKDLSDCYGFRGGNRVVEPSHRSNWEHVMFRKQILVLALCSLCGCMSGFNRDALTARFQNEGQVVTDEEITKIRALKPQLNFPCKIAVYMADENPSWRWTQQDKLELEGWAKGLVDAGIASDIFFISEMFTDKQPSLQSLRVASAKYGADALLTVRGAAQVDSYLNPAAVLNVTVVGGFVIPTHHRDALFMIRGALVDVGNGYLYATAESESVGKIIRPYFLVEDKDAIDKAKTMALPDFGSEMSKRIRMVHEAYARDRRAAKD
jgi:hypothetical protein